MEVAKQQMINDANWVTFFNYFKRVLNIAEYLTKKEVTV